MGIKNGKYTIMTVQTGQLVGRELVEDRSFNPKRVVVLDNPIPAVVCTAVKLIEQNHALLTKFW